MKNKVSNFIKQFGYNCRYSGKQKTMFLHSSKSAKRLATLAQVKGHIYNTFGKLEFKLQ